MRWLGGFGIALGCALASTVGCRCSSDARDAKAATSPAVVALPPAHAAPVAARTLGAVAGPEAFELVATSEGAALAWAAPGACDASLHVQRLDADGRELGASERSGVAACGAQAAKIVELSAASAAGKLGLAWITEMDHAASVFSTYGPDDAETLAPAQRMSAAALIHSAQRGRLMMSVSPAGQFHVAYRAPEGNCVDEPGRCAQLVTQALPASAMRGADTREVKAACPRMLLGAYAMNGTWYDAFCALSGGTGKDEPLTQVQAIRPEIFYAEVVPVLAGCEPLGVSPTTAGRGVAVWGLCGGVLRAHVVAVQGHELVLDGVSREAKCAQGRPLLTLVAGNGTRLEIPLDEPRDRLELLLPPELASPLARAAFTGRRLLVTDVQQNALVLRSFVCNGDALVEAAALL